MFYFYICYKLQNILFIIFVLGSQLSFKEIKIEKNFLYLSLPLACSLLLGNLNFHPNAYGPCTSVSQIKVR